MQNIENRNEEKVHIPSFRGLTAITIVFALLLTMAFLFTGCTSGAKTFASLSDFKGAKIGSLAGAAFAKFIDPVIPDVTHKNYDTFSKTVEALSSGEVDALALDMPVAKHLTAQNTEYVVFSDVVADDRYGFAVPKGSSLAEKANEALQKLKDNGTISELESIWFSADENVKKLPVLDYKENFDGSAGTLTYGCANANEPMSYLGSDGKPLGFDLDIVSRIAYEMNMTVEFVPMSFDELFADLDAGEVDMAGGSMSITEERQTSYDFVGSYYEGGVVLVIKNERLGK